MSEGQEPIVFVIQNGPYVVRGGVGLKIQSIGVDAEGASETWVEEETLEVGAKYSLCRCGHSKEAPFCDGTHREIGFDGTETALKTPYDEVKEVVDGPRVQLEDARCFCAMARFCDRGKDAWDGAAVADDDAALEHLRSQVADCPSGRLRLRNKATGELIEPSFPLEIIVSEDPSEGCSGPLWVRGGIVLEGADDVRYEVRNRMTLCRCGASKNKPFCDGSHVEIKYRAHRPLESEVAPE
jgi:CDGSH-type Zn-finger protein